MNFQNCTKCVLEASPLANLSFDEDGICNNCREYDKYIIKSDADNWVKKKAELNELVEKIKKKGEKKKYDCILGVSGGFDSTYLALVTKEYGLRPLVVHFDNGWNSELAVQNIHNIVNKLGYDLHTYVINWEEFKDLQLAYFKASVIDLEIPTDHFIYATLYKIAAKNNVKYILDGNNYATEFGHLSLKWSFHKYDLKNLLAIHKIFGTIPLKTFPKLGMYQRYYYNEILKIETARLINFLPLNKIEITKRLENELNWHDPGGKHYESIFTRFYQGYILPKKFGVDKRRYHLSNLIWSGQMSRIEALKQLELPTYDLKMQEDDKSYLLKKYNLSEDAFEALMKLPPVEHNYYGIENNKGLLIQVLQFPLRFKRKIVRIVKKSFS